MARNKVENHIQPGAFFTFKVNAGETLVPGNIVKITGDREVGAAGAGEDAIGVVYGGTVGKQSFVGNDGDVATVVVLKPFIYMTAGGVVAAGDNLQVAANHKVVKVTTGVKVAKAVTSAAADGDVIIAMLG
ncbi:hypothetical protein EG878_14515 [Enterococcus faecalis]|nr:hypothetical protein EG878_14515 [Enterococcus faecalis]